MTQDHRGEQSPLQVQVQGQNKKYDVKKLTTPEDCRRVMQRALERNDMEFYQAVARRHGELVSQEHSDPLVADFYGNVLATYELLLEEKNGRKQAASYTRRKLNRLIAEKQSVPAAVEQCLIDWTVGPETPGFKLLIARGLPELTGEAALIRHASRFPDNVVRDAKARLAKAA